MRAWSTARSVAASRRFGFLGAHLAGLGPTPAARDLPGLELASVHVVGAAQRGGQEAVPDFAGVLVVDLAPTECARSAPPWAGGARDQCGPELVGAHVVDGAQRGGLQAIWISWARSCPA